MVANEVPGLVKAILFESGQTVEKGDLLVQLDDEVDQAELGSLKAAERLAEIEFKRNAKLVNEKTVSQADYDRAKATLEGATALRVAKQAEIRQKAILAPFAGALGIRAINLGEYLSPGSKIVALQSLDPVYVDFSLPERYLGQLQEGQIIDIGVQAFPNEVFTGKISVVSPRVEIATRSVSVRATLSNPEYKLRPGMFANVTTRLGDTREYLTLPERAITFNPYGDTVFVVEEQDGKQMVNRRQVQTGAVKDGRIAILSGLELGETVVAAGQNKLRNGQAVVIDNSVQLDAQSIGE
jgi:membrane fusion protein (multidrug efflux system)